jgi:hypothetical protein
LGKEIHAKVERAFGALVAHEPVSTNALVAAELFTLGALVNDYFTKK